MFGKLRDFLDSVTTDDLERAISKVHNLEEPGEVKSKHTYLTKINHRVFKKYCIVSIRHENISTIKILVNAKDISKGFF